jgi:L-aminopeptidase/D-esterase-like protein
MSERRSADPINHVPTSKLRARDLALDFKGRTGTLNAITDVPGVEVGHVTLVEGDDGPNAVRTGVTAVLPRGKDDALAPVWGAGFSLNGNGEMTGTHWLEESGTFIGPIAITNTHSVGAVHQGVLKWLVARLDGQTPYEWLTPIVAETWDGYLSDINGFHVTDAHAICAIKAARGGPVAEGSVGGGTGMIAFEFKGGCGTASRLVELQGQLYTVGAIVQANHGIRPWLTVLGAPVGLKLTHDRLWDKEKGSIIAIAATNAPLLPLQMKRLARRIALGVGRSGTPSGDNSGDIFLAFSTANREVAAARTPARTMSFLGNEYLDPFFLAVVEATEEAILNALVAGETTVGRNGRRVVAIDHGELVETMREYGRIKAGF